MINQKHNLSNDDRRAHEAKNGGYNDFPPNWQEVDVGDFSKSQYFSFQPDLLEHRQMLHYRFEEGREHDGPCVDATLHWYFDGTGYAIVNDYWGGAVKFYRFGQLNPAAYDGIDSSD